MGVLLALSEPHGSIDIWSLLLGNGDKNEKAGIENSFSMVQVEGYGKLERTLKAHFSCLQALDPVNPCLLQCFRPFVVDCLKRRCDFDDVLEIVYKAASPYATESVLADVACKFTTKNVLVVLLAWCESHGCVGEKARIAAAAVKAGIPLPPAHAAGSDAAVFRRV